MRKTQFRAVYELKDVTAIGDSIPSTMDNMDFANESFLKQNAEFPNYGTLEKISFILMEACRSCRMNQRRLRSGQAVYLMRMGSSQKIRF